MSDQPTRSSPPEGAPAAGTEAAGTTGSLDAAGRTTSPGVPQFPVGPPPNVPGYEILGELGRGGMGVVYQARQVRLNRRVALKVILAGGHASVAERVRFLQEAEAVAALDHPNVVRVYEVGQPDGLPYMGLEFVPGGTLGGYARGPLPAREAAALVEQIARGVGHAHSHGVVHRDLKPDNILLVPGEPGVPPTPKVADFGLAKRVEAGAGLTSTGAVLGTPAYMAPEQAGGGAKHVGPPADVWALGAILYRLLTGRPPFPAPSAVEVIRLVLDSPPEPPSRVAPGVPRELEVVCLKCLQKDPAARYPTANELAADLHRWLDGEAVQARLPRGRLYRRIALGAGILILAAAGTWVASRIDRTKSAPPPGAPAPLPAPGEQIEAIAVLPFENVGGKPETAFLADGIGESVSNSLSAIRPIKVHVRPFASAAAARDETDLKALGRKLHVQAVVTGRVTRDGDRVAVAARLVDVRHDVQLWGNQYESAAGNAFPVQQAIAREVAQALKLTPARVRPPATSPPPPPSSCI